MTTGRQGIYLACVVLLSLTPGCTPPEQFEQDSSRREISVLEGQLEDLRGRIRELEDRNTIQAGRIEELEARNEQLTDLVNELQFDKKMLERHVEALSPAPKERDRLQAENDQLREEIEQLRRRLGELSETAPAE